MLFGVLNQNIFMLFAGENRSLYQEVLLRIYDSCFGSDLLFPTRNELVGIIYDVLAARPELWHDEGSLVTLDQVSSRGRRLKPRNRAEGDREATVEAMGRARHIYARLIDTGWLEESRYGLRVTVDMPPAAMRLADFLSTLHQGSSEQLGGLIVEVRNALEGVRVNAAHNALGLHKAAQDALGFGRYLRTVLSSLREIEKQVLASRDLGERLQHFFEDFVDRILLQDYAAISTTAHPYRFRYAILDAVQQLEDSPVDVDSLAKAYSEAHLAPDRERAHDMVFDDLDKIRRVLGQIDEAFLHIQQHRARLEVRLRNTVRYAGRRADAFLRLPETAGAVLDAIEGAWSRNVGWASLRPRDGDGLVASIKLALALKRTASDAGEFVSVDYRTFARRNADDSKVLERRLRLVAELYRRFFPSEAGADYLDDAELLAGLGVERFSQPLLVGGAISLDGILLPRTPFVGIPAEQISRLSVSSPSYVLLIENYASFVRHCREVNDAGHAVVIYTGGFPSRAILAAIETLVPPLRCSVFHWGDIDRGGLLIFMHLERALARRSVTLVPHLMDIEILERHGTRTDTKLQALPADVGRSAIVELWRHMIGLNSPLSLEQEELDPVLPVSG